MYRQLLVQGVLAVLLPTEDLENVYLRTLAGDVLADLILDGEVSDKACEGWFIWEAITKLIAVFRGNGVSNEVENIQKSRLERFGLLSTKEDQDGDDSPGSSQSYVSALFWRTLQYSYLACIAIRFVVAGLFRVASSPSSILTRGPVATSTPTIPINSVGEIPPLSSNSIARTPVLKYRVFGMISQLADLSKRMPWLAGSLALAQHAIVNGPGRLGEADGILDK
jgi:hypothetical protein